MTHDVPSHANPPTDWAETTLADYLRRLPIAGEAVPRNPRGAGTMSKTLVQAAVLADLLHKPRSVVIECLQTALDASVAAFQLASTKERIEVVVAGQASPATGIGPTDGANVANWETAFGLSLALRREPATAVLTAIDVDVLRASPGRADAYRYTATSALQAFHRGGDWQTLVAQAASESGPEQTRVTGREIVDVVMTPLAMLAPLAARDTAAFDRALVAALQAHHRYWSSKAWAGHAIGWIALVPTGLAALAHDRKMTSEVTSGYLPAWLVRGELSS